MKKFLLTLLKTVLFFIGWAVIGGIIEIPSEDPTVWRFWAELVPFAVMVIFSAVFWLIEKRKFPIIEWKNPLKNILLGIFGGCAWIVIPVGILKSTGTISFAERNSVSSLWLWAVSCFLNVVMQELLARGYIYQLIKYNYNTAAAVAVTTLLFTLLHGGAFEEGIIPVLCVVTMSLFMSLVLIYSESLVAPILLHFAWNFIGAVILNVVELAEDYPNLLTAVIRGNKALSGGNCLIEGSAVVLALNIILSIVIILLLRKNAKGTKLKFAADEVIVNN